MIAAWIAARVVGTPALPLVTGLLVWVAVGLTLLGLRLPLTAPTLFGAGTVSGVMGTLTGIGAIRPWALGLAATAAGVLIVRSVI